MKTRKRVAETDGSGVVKNRKRGLAVWHAVSAFAITFFGIITAHKNWPDSWG
jgi:hypothetical protein